MEVEWRWNGDFTIPEWEWECIPIVRGRNGNGNAFRLSWVGMGMGMHSENSRNGHKSVYLLYLHSDQLFQKSMKDEGGEQ